MCLQVFFRHKDNAPFRWRWPIRLCSRTCAVGGQRSGHVPSLELRERCAGLPVTIRDPISSGAGSGGDAGDLRPGGALHHSRHLPGDCLCSLRVYILPSSRRAQLSGSRGRAKLLINTICIFGRVCDDRPCRRGARGPGSLDVPARSRRLVRAQ